MLKKFVSSLLALVILAGCAGGSDISSRQSAKATAEQLVNNLGLTDSMKEIKERHIQGYFFQGEEITTDASVFYSTETGNSDTVGVFYTEDPETCLSYIETYLVDQKSQTQTYYPEEVFKISNAIVDSEGHVVILVICNDIERGKKIVSALLGK